MTSFTTPHHDLSRHHSDHLGLVGAVLKLSIGQFLLIVVQPIWARVLIALVFVAPATNAGYHAKHGIVKHAIPSDVLQIVFSLIGAVVAGATAFTGVAGMAAPASRP